MLLHESAMNMKTTVVGQLLVYKDILFYK
ncbi:hypothetical protein CAT7_07062 [Carnobacterium sp. AT7]|nr:hypothetical protein CAT7_07062 [Carnobacterium sp. AT7]